jgi:hypothetical protein
VLRRPIATSTGFSVVVQDVVLGAALSAYVDAITSRPRYVVVLCPRVDVVTVREAGRTKRAYRPGMFDADVLDRSLRTETPRIGLWLDSSDQTPAQTADAIVSRADEALVDDAELARFHDAATRRGLTLEAIRAAARLEFPVADIETMLDEIKRGSAQDTP